MATPGSGAGVVREQLCSGKVVPDAVSDLEENLIDLRVLYKELEIANGLAMRKAQTQFRPRIQIRGPSAGDKVDLYTLVMVDPDAPSPDKPSYRNFLHWLVVNIPRNVPPSQDIWEAGHEVVPYMGPSPPEGDHRYVFLVFKQSSGPLDGSGMNQSQRKNFNVDEFSKSHQLGKPIGGMYYLASANDELVLKQGYQQQT